MHLTDEEKEILDGKQGHSKQKSLELLIALGEIYDAGRLINVKSVHVPGAFILGVGQAGLRFVEEMGQDETCITVYATTNPSSMPPEGAKGLGLTKRQIEDQNKLTRAYEKMGFYVCNTCTPYLIGNLPGYGEHISWGESSAIAYANSVIGARTNREGGPSALASAITGKTPLYGYHIKANRRGSVLVKVKKELHDVSAYGTLGYFAGKHMEKGVPVFEGIPGCVRIDELKMLSAAVASSSSVALFHIIGITPEALSREQAFRGGKPYTILEYGSHQEEETIQSLSKAENNELEWVVLGCPHASIQEIREIARLLEGKRINSNVIMWVNTSVPVAEYAKRLGYAQIIEKAGGRIICETCPVHTPTQVYAKKQGIQSVTTNSAKLAHYAPGQFGLPVHYGDLERCIQGAIKGRWI